jgi:hypothetical protein
MCPDAGFPARTTALAPRCLLSTGAGSNPAGRAHQKSSSAGICSDRRLAFMLCPAVGVPLLCQMPYRLHRLCGVPCGQSCRPHQQASSASRRLSQAADREAGQERAAPKHYGSVVRGISRVAKRSGGEVVQVVCKLCPRSHRQFAVYPRQVGFHGLDGHEEFRGGLLI